MIVPSIDSLACCPWDAETREIVVTLWILLNVNWLRTEFLHSTSWAGGPLKWDEAVKKSAL